MNRNYLNSLMYSNIMKGWLILMLFFIPFQRNLGGYIMEWSVKLAIFINRIDELTLAIFIPLAIIEFYRKRKIINYTFMILLLPFICVGVSGLMSGIVNGNSLYITILGIVDYIKIFLFIFVYAAFFSEFSIVEKIFRALLIVAVVLGAVAFVQELWALSQVYILGKDIREAEVYIFRRLPEDMKLAESYWRFGIYRASSLVGHYNLLGSYSLLILTIYLSISKKVNFIVFSALLTGIIVSMSRMNYLGFAMLLVIQIIKGRKWLFYLIVPIAISLFFMGTLWDSNIWKFSDLLNSTELSSITIAREHPEIEDMVSFREYTKNKAMEVWKDSPIWGVGPGMFGGTISVSYNSPVYEEYNFEAMRYLQEIVNFDQVWPQILAETGVVGIASFTGLFVSLMAMLSIFRHRSSFSDTKNLLLGLVIFMIIIIAWGFGGSFKNATIYIYCAFVGIGLGCCSNKELCKPVPVR